MRNNSWKIRDAKKEALEAIVSDYRNQVIEANRQQAELEAKTEQLHKENEKYVEAYDAIILHNDYSLWDKLNCGKTGHEIDTTKKSISTDDFQDALNVLYDADIEQDEAKRILRLLSPILLGLKAEETEDIIDEAARWEDYYHIGLYVNVPELEKSFDAVWQSEEQINIGDHVFAIYHNEPYEAEVVSIYTTKEEIDYTIEKVKEVVALLRKMSPVWDKLQKGEIKHVI